MRLPDKLAKAVETRDLRLLEQIALSMSYADLRQMAIRHGIDLDDLEELLGKL